MRIGESRAGRTSARSSSCRGELAPAVVPRMLGRRSVHSTDLAFALLAANPFGGLLVAIPFAMLKLHYPAWVATAMGAPLAYLQVVVVDASWSWLARIPGWQRFLERRRSPRVARLVASRGAFWITFVVTPLLGPWLVMAFMRYAQVDQR